MLNVVMMIVVMLIVMVPRNAETNELAYFALTEKTKFYGLDT
jgi:hypothetical protein